MYKGQNSEDAYLGKSDVKVDIYLKLPKSDLLVSYSL